MKESAVREKILDVASRLFYEQGYNSTGINQIIDEADIARASLYHYFPSKKDLLIAYLHEAETAWFRNLDVFLASIKDPKKKLLALFDYRMERQYKSSFGGCQFIKVSAEIEKTDLSTFSIVARQKEKTKEYIVRLLKEVTLSDDSPLNKDMLADMLFLLMEGGTVNGAITKNASDMKKAKKIAEKLL